MTAQKNDSTEMEELLRTAGQRLFGISGSKPNARFCIGQAVMLQEMYDGQWVPGFVERAWYNGNERMHEYSVEYFPKLGQYQFTVVWEDMLRPLPSPEDESSDEAECTPEAVPCAEPRLSIKDLERLLEDSMMQ